MDNPYEETDHPIKLDIDKTLIGHGREGEGLYGKNADLEAVGQIVIHEAWLFAESVRCVYSCYATISGENGDEYNDRAQPYVASLPGFVEWNDDEWVVTAGPFTLEHELPDDLDFSTEEAAITNGTAWLYDLIEADDFAKVFVTELGGVHAVLEEIYKEMAAKDPQFYLA